MEEDTRKLSDVDRCDADAASPPPRPRGSPGKKGENGRHPNRAMERVAAHPLLSASISEETHSTTSSSAYAASLIQSASRSILDGDAVVSPASHVSDDGGDSAATGAAANHRSLPSPTLHSLQRRKLPAVPDEQDRKRFVGAFAAILASLYDYDTEGERDNRAESEAYLNISEHDSFEMDEVGALDRQESVESSVYSEPVDAFNQMNAPPPKRRPRKRDRVRISRNRHRQRRYDVFSQLLVSAAEQLGLEKSQGKCFLPMLSRLLVSQSNKEPPAASSGRPPRPSVSASEALSIVNDGSRASLHFAAVDFLDRQMDRIEHLRPFLESLGPGAGLRCSAMLLMQHLLHSEKGYDARVRHAVKTLGVLVLVHDMTQDPDLLAVNDSCGSRERPDVVTLAARKFESLEHFVALKLIELSQEQRRLEQGRHPSGKKTGKVGSLRSRMGKGVSRDNLVRSLKIGGTALAAGTLFAITGGLAAPGIAAGIATIAGGTVITAAAATLLTSTAVVTALFGVGGGSLAAYKMQRRTVGLTEFEFHKETGEHSPASRTKTHEDDIPEAELFSTICLSGWLRDDFDFQRPWGLTPSRPPLGDRLELLERFYSIYSPDHIQKCEKILSEWQGDENRLWTLLRQKYGRDPYHLFPLENGPRLDGSLTHEEREVIGQLFVDLGCTTAPAETPKQQTPFERMRMGRNKRVQEPQNGPGVPARELGVRSPWDSLHGPHANETPASFAEGSNLALSESDMSSTAMSMQSDKRGKKKETGEKKVPKHLATVWDYQTTYGGELYTVRWESDLLLELCDSVADLAFDVVTGGTAQLLKHTALSTLLSAVAWPYALVNAANMIDGTWTLAVERSDEAGKELARSLLFSTAGHRPVTLAGFSFGARAIYSCLKELSRYQEKWEDFHGRENSKAGTDRPSPEEDFRNMREPASIVEDVILMGLPNHLSLASWKACRQVVSGRLVHCYSEKDLILSLMFQLKKFGFKPVCGTCPVEVPGVENVNVTDLVSGHQDYCLNTGAILKRVRHCEPFQSSCPRSVASEFNANDVVREVAKLDMK